MCQLFFMMFSYSVEPMYFKAPNAVEAFNMIYLEQGSHAHKSSA
jgi:hypothetical protein